MREAPVFFTREGLGEDVRDHVVRGTELNTSTIAAYQVISEVVVLALDVLRAGAELRLLREGDSAGVVAVDGCGSANLAAELRVEATEPRKLLAKIAQGNILGLCR